jgi:hypothetical protein
MRIIFMYPPTLGWLLFGYLGVIVGISYLWFRYGKMFRKATRVGLSAVTFLVVFAAVNTGAYAAHHYGPSTDFGTTADAASTFGLASNKTYPVELSRRAVSYNVPAPYFSINSLVPDTHGDLIVNFVTGTHRPTLKVPAKKINLEPGKATSMSITLDQNFNYGITVKRSYSACTPTILDGMLICRQTTVSKTTVVDEAVPRAGLDGAVNGNVYSATLILPPSAFTKAQAAFQTSN